MTVQTTSGTSGVFKSEMALWCGILTTAAFLMFGYDMLGDLSSSVRFLLLFGWLFAVMLWLSFGVVRPYGTLILTLAVISIEVVMISAVMITGDNVPTLARDTMFAVLMIILNGLLGLTLLLGGLKHREQEYNMTGAKTYLGVIVPLAVLGLILPRFTTSAPGGQVTPLMAVFLLLMSGGLYVVFLLIQTRRHTQFFKQPSATVEDHADDHHHEGLVIRSVGHHVLFLVLTMLPIVLLSKNMAKLVDHGIETLSAPQALGGFLVAILVLSPEGMAAIKSALSNQLQRTVNIGLGSALSTIGLTIPAVLVISLVTGRTVELGLEAAEIVLLILTLVVAAINFGTGRTNIMQGAVHLIIFLAYIVLIFD
jgi:Ca2+:H+ antiporter